MMLRKSGIHYREQQQFLEFANKSTDNGLRITYQRLIGNDSRMNVFVVAEDANTHTNSLRLRNPKHLLSNSSARKIKCELSA